MSVVIPARDEAARIGPCLAGLAGDPDVHEVIVVDDGSTDAHGGGRRARTARAWWPGREPPPGWVGKPWALQQGLEAARGRRRRRRSTPTPGRGRAWSARWPAALDDADLVTAGARFVCEAAGERLLHPSMLASLVYRYGPADADAPGRAAACANGQVTAVRREALLAAGGYARGRRAT